MAGSRGVHCPAGPASCRFGRIFLMTIDALPDVGGHPDRLVVLEAVHNFRDLGGYPTADGRVTRWRTLYRADGLHRLTPGDVELLRPLGLRTVLDLRTDRELEQRG